MTVRSLPLLAFLGLAAGTVLAANPSENPDGQLMIYPKNLARHHLGSNLFHYDESKQTYTPTEAAAAWLDDDIATGWPTMAGKQYYILSLAEAQLVTNFSVSMRPAAGTISLYSGDEPSAPGAKSWNPLAKDLPLESVNAKKLEQPFSRFAKYLLIETNIAEPAPIFSLYVYGQRPAVSYRLTKREHEIDVKAIFGPFTNDRGAFSVTGLYAGSRVIYSNAADGFLAWQKVADDNPQSTILLTPTTDQSGAVVQLSDEFAINRIALLTNEGAKGRLDFFLVPKPAKQPAVTDTAPTENKVTQASNVTSAPAVAVAASLQDLTPAVTMVLDGSNPRLSQDFAAIPAATILVRWTPENGTDSLTIHELNAFNDHSLANYVLEMSPEAIAEFSARDASKDGKDFKSAAAANEAPPPVGEFLDQRSPYLPGALGFPPFLTTRDAAVSP